MNKVNELSKVQKNEEKLLIAKVLDKVKFCNEKNKYQSLNFLDLSQQLIVEKALKIRKIDTYELYGGYDEAERKILILYPQQHIENIRDIDMYKKNIYIELFSAIRIELPKELYNKYGHRTYLGALMKLGLKREVIGDILVRSNGADIIALKELNKFIQNDIKGLIRFQKSVVKVLPIDKLFVVKPEKKIIKINVSSMRLDCIVAELANCSRNEANKIIEQERVFLNFKEELVSSKKVELGSFITIRGKGRFKIIDLIGKTRSGRLIVEVEI